MTIPVVSNNVKDKKCVIYGNEQAASTEPEQPFPYGSIIVMGTWCIQTDANNNPVLDALGRFQSAQDKMTAMLNQHRCHF